MKYQSEFLSHSADKTFELGQHLGEVLDFPFVILLKGDMGAGKTLITKGIVKGLGFGDDVSSPTYTIVNEYENQTENRVYHFDLYRLQDVDELYEMGFEDYLVDGAGLILEWPDLIENERFSRRLEIRIEKLSDDLSQRRISLETDDDQIAAVFKKLG